MIKKFLFYVLVFGICTTNTYGMQNDAQDFGKKFKSDFLATITNTNSDKYQTLDILVTQIMDSINSKDKNMSRIFHGFILNMLQTVEKLSEIKHINFRSSRDIKIWLNNILLDLNALQEVANCRLTPLGTNLITVKQMIENILMQVNDQFHN